MHFERKARRTRSRFGAKSQSEVKALSSTSRPEKAGREGDVGCKLVRSSDEQPTPTSVFDMRRSAEASMTQVSTSSGKHFKIVDGESFLDADLRADVALGYGCRTARCGTCRGRVRRGETIPKHHEVGLSEVERTTGQILTCVRSAQSDAELDIHDLGDVRLSAHRTLPQADLCWDARDTGNSHHYTPVLSRADASWKGAQGHVQQSALAQIPDWAHTAVYACGSEAMIHDARRQLNEAGLVESRFLSDAFVCSSDAA